MKILVIGSGGREHALCFALNKSKLLTSLYAIPGNPGISEIGTCVDIDIFNFTKIKDFCINHQIDIVIIGPELPLSEGITDFLESFNIKVIGCNSFSAQLESSKIFSKKLCDDTGIKTAKYLAFYNQKDAILYLDSIKKYPQVIKADGLAAGKGVIIAENYNQAVCAVKDIFSGKFGNMSKLIIEEFLSGVEASFFAISDGQNFKLLSCAGDHKRIGDNDIGPNTGGMGTYSPSPFVTKDIEEEVVNNILKPSFTYLKEQGQPYKGIIFAGLMITEQKEVYLIEYNVRFGDPEAQSILSRLNTDFLQICDAVTKGTLNELEIAFSDEKAITLVLAADGYPNNYKKGNIINNIKQVNSLPKINVFHAGTKLDQDGNLLSNGGRVINITALGKDFSEAYNKVYAAAKMVDWQDKYYRTDIGKKIL